MTSSLALKVALAAAGAHALFAPSANLRTPRRQVACSMTERYDAAVIGGGPAGSVLAWRLAHQEGLSVALVDPALDAKWKNNYGVWMDEWETLNAELGPEVGLSSCVDASWNYTDCYFGGAWGMPSEERTRLERGYCRVDREVLRRRLRADQKVHQIKGKVAARASETCPNVYDNSEAIVHDNAGTTITLSSGEKVRARVVVDCTGFESMLTTRAREPAPGFQIAYGFEATVSSLGPYDSDAMVLFDYRTDHLDTDEFPPTFMYAMPLGNDRVFFEETVLVSKPALSLAECERRCAKRLDHLGIQLLSPKTDIELCYIPMGGPLPDKGQRMIAFGAAAGLVHPATGYQLCRALKASGDVAKALGVSLRDPTTPPDIAAARAYAALWGKTTKLQRDFALFGGDFLLTLDSKDLRGWFTAFFALPIEVWAGFLAFWPGFLGNEHHETRLNRLTFGLKMVSKLPLPVCLKLFSFMIAHTFSQGPVLLQSVVPFLGDGDYFAENPAQLTPRVLGDPYLKRELKERGTNLDSAVTIDDQRELAATSTFTSTVPLTTPKQ